MLTSDLKNQSNARTLLLGLVLLIALLDHTRMFFHYWNTNPGHLETTTTALFFTRFVSYFFAPAALLVIGISAGLSAQNRSKSLNAGYSLKTGFLLLFVEVFLNNFMYTFDVRYRTIGLFFVGLLGCCYLLMAGFQYLPQRVFLLLCLLMLVGHPLLDGISFSGSTASSIAGYILHQQKFLSLNGRTFIVNYTLLPWFALFGLGYLCAPMYVRDPHAHAYTRPLFTLGMVLLFLFVVLRLTSGYAEPHPFSVYRSTEKTLMSFFNLTKYPASLCYTCITLGATFVFLSAGRPFQQRIPKAIGLLGSNFLFVYVFSTFFIHFMAMLVFRLKGGQWSAMVITSAAYLPDSPLREWGFPLIGVYGIWILISLGVYAVMKLLKRLEARA